MNIWEINVPKATQINPSPMASVTWCKEGATNVRDPDTAQNTKSRTRNKQVTGILLPRSA